MLNKKHIILLGLFLGFFMPVFSTAYAGTQSTWAHEYSIEYDGYWYNGFPGAIQQTIEGGYIVAGTLVYSSDPAPDWDSLFVMKLDVRGNFVWERSYSISNGDGASSVQQTTDGGYIIAGGTIHSGGINYDIWILKLDLSGNIIWQKTYGPPGGGALPYTIHQTPDGGFIVSAGTYLGDSYVWIMKLNNSGNIIWQKIYGPNVSSSDIQQTADGGYIALGSTSPFGALILKLNSSGNIIWQKTYGGSSDEYAYSIQRTSDGGYIVAGSIFSSGWGRMWWILKLNTSGGIIWQKTYGGSGWGEAYSIQQTSDGGYIVAGYNSIVPGTTILKLDASGNIIWQNAYGNSSGIFQQTTDGGYIIVGGSGGFQVLKIDSSGNMVPSCDLVHSTTIVSSDYSATVANSNVSVFSPTFNISNTSATGVMFDVTDTLFCLCLPPHGCMSITAADLDASADSGVRVCWKQDPDDNPADWGDSSYGTRTYDMLRDGTTIASSIVYGTTCFIDTTGTNSLTYTYAVRYNNGCGLNAISPSAKAADYLAALISQKPIIEDSGNGIIEPDETVTLRGALHNITTNTATSVIGHLTILSPIVMGNAHAAYPDINPGNTENCLTCYTITAPSANRPSTHWDFEAIETPDCAGCSLFKYNFIYHIGNSFSDVHTSQPFYPYIEKLLHSGVTGGCTNTAYCPSNTVKRDNIAKFICLSMALTSPCSCIVSGCTGIFEDVPQSNIFCPYIEALYNAGIISGCMNNPPHMCSSQPINRAQMAKFICNAMNAAVPGSCVPSSCTGIFQDVPASNVFCSYIEALYDANVVSGCSTSPKLYCPNNLVQRDQMAKYLVNAFTGIEW